MRALFIIALAVLLAPVAAADSYVHVGLQPEFQYQDNRDVKVKLQAVQVVNDLPTDQPLTVSVKLDGKAFRLVNQASFDRGVSARSVHSLNFGELEAGFYEASITVSSGTQSRTRSVDLSVTKPPIKYAGTLESKGRDAVFLFHPGSEDFFTIRTYYNGPTGRTILEEVWTNETTEVQVQGIRDTVTLVEVEGPNGWLNHGNPQTNFLLGTTEYVPWTWFPDVENTEQMQQLRLTYGIILAVVATGLIAYGITLKVKEARRGE